MFIAARDEGECVDCGQPIQRGQQAMFVDERELVHMRCPKPVTLCQKCFMIPCECDE